VQSASRHGRRCQGSTQQPLSRRGAAAASVKNAELFLEVRENSVPGFSHRVLQSPPFDGRDGRRVETFPSIPRTVLGRHVDLDRFKDINDRYGHLCGDAVTRSDRAADESHLRSTDFRCRYGGGVPRFSCRTLDVRSAEVAEMLRRDFEDHPLAWKDQFIPVTASFGVTGVVAAKLTRRQSLARRCGALSPKQDGRNCVCIADLHESVA
jgi:diguanylate cyclase (GGDEF)-like protein